MLDRNVDLDSDARAIADGDLVEGFSDQFRDRARDRIEVSQLGEVVCAVLADLGDRGVCVAVGEIGKRSLVESLRDVSAIFHQVVIGISLTASSSGAGVPIRRRSSCERTMMGPSRSLLL